MEAENQIRTQLQIYARRARSPGFARAVERDLALPADRLFLQRVVRALEFFRRIFRSFRLEHGARGFPEIIRDGMKIVTGSVLSRTKEKRAPSRAISPRLFSPPSARHLPFLDGRGVAGLGQSSSIFPTTRHRCGRDRSAVARRFRKGPGFPAAGNDFA